MPAPILTLASLAPLSLVVELATASTSRNVSPSLSHGLPPDSYLPPRVDVAPPAFDVEVLPDVSEGALVTAGGGGGTQLVAAELRDLSVAVIGMREKESMLRLYCARPYLFPRCCHLCIVPSCIPSI